MAEFKNQYVKSFVDKIKDEKKCEEDLAFLYLCTALYSKLSINEIDKFITDSIANNGEDDKKIDAIYYDTEGESLKDLCFIQTTISNTLSENKASKFINGVKNHWINNDNGSFQNQRMQQIWNDTNGKIPSSKKHKVLYCFNGIKENETLINDIKALHKDLDCIFWDINDIDDRLSDGKRKTNDFDFTFDVFRGSGSIDASIVTYAKTNIEASIFLLKASDIIKLIETCIDKTNDDNFRALFDQNIRGYLGIKTNVNREISKTIRSENDKFFFSVLNNGITIVSEEATINPKIHNKITVTVKNPSIINGLQTAITIYEEFKNHQKTDNNIKPEDIFDGIEILVRIYQVSNKKRDLVDNIIKGTNMQNAIDTRDLIANERISQKCEEFFKNYGYTYIRKRSYDILLSSKSIHQDVALQKWYATFFGNPNRAKQYKSLVLDRFYEALNYNDEKTELYNNVKDLDNLTKEIFIASVIYIELVDKNNREKIKSNKNDYVFLDHCEDMFCYCIYKILYSSNDLNLIMNFKNNEDKLKSVYEKSLKIMQDLINNKRDNKTSYANFFKNRNSLKLIDNEIEKLTNSIPN